LRSLAPRPRGGPPVTVPVELAMANWADAEDQARRTDLAFVPLGAVEVYGRHMPQGTDGIVATALCRALATRVDALIAPLIPVGYSAVLQAFPTTLNVDPEALFAYSRGIVASLLRLGVRRVLFINGHAGNVPTIDGLCRELAAPDRRFAQVDVWRFVQPLTADLLDSTEWKYGHAGEAGTSVMLHLHPELVKMERATKEAPVLPGQPLGLSAPRSYREVSPQGTVGDATLATAAKGQEIFRRTVDALEAFVRSPDFTVGPAAAGPATVAAAEAVGPG
ncbi:MAG: creatininase family protein, partial [Candidatus Dormiibacterota bacterium]